VGGCRKLKEVMNMAVPVKGTVLGFITSCGGIIAWTYKQRLLGLFHRGRKAKTLAVREPKTNNP
jgi:hypothetical protein